jgi:hypothetical protein
LDRRRGYLAQIHLAFIDFPQVNETEAYRLFLAGNALENGVSPAELMKALGSSEAALDLEKYREDQPRVPVGSGSESGQWTSWNWSGAVAPAQAPVRVAENTQNPTLSDANPDPVCRANNMPSPSADVIFKMEPQSNPLVKRLFLSTIFPKDRNRFYNIVTSFRTIRPAMACRNGFPWRWDGIARFAFDARLQLGGCRSQDISSRQSPA